jgi:hypothetical protein
VAESIFGARGGDFQRRVGITGHPIDGFYDGGIENFGIRSSMASAVLARSTAANGTGGGFMGKVPFSNPNPNPNFKTKKRHQQKQQKQNHHHQHHNEIDESPAVTQSAAASDDASSINHRRHNSSTTTEFNLNNNKQSQKQYVSFNIATYSKKQLGDLKSRLVAELDQIRQLRHQIEIQSTAPSNPNQVPPSSKKSKKLSGKKRPLPSLPLDNPIRNPNPNEASLMKACKDILTKLRKHKSGWVFNEPVDVEGMGLHDYYDIIKQPMDLGTVKSRLARDFYRSPAEFANDVRLTFTNALTYNPKGHLVHGMADQLLVRFEELFRPIGDKIDPIGKVSVSVDHHPQQQQQQHRAHSEQQRRVFDVDGEELQASSWNNNINIDDEDDRLDGAADDDNSMPIVEKSERIEKVSGDNSERLQAPTSSSNPPMKSAPPVKPLKQPKPKAKDPNKREMNLEEKHKLGIGLQSLPPEKMEQVVQIIRKRNGHLKQDGDEIELDIEAVDTETLWELDRLVTNWKKMVSKIKRQALMGNNMKNNGDLPMSEKIEVVASEAKKPKKGGEAGEEDVDIGDEMPMSNFPPVEIEKDVGGHASSSSSSSSSSDSDSSSSSDSDSGSSSGSDSDAADNAQS